MSKLGKGWSSVRGRATHYYDSERPRALTADCGSPVRIDWEEGTKKLRALTVCDGCQHVRRKRAKR